VVQSYSEPSVTSENIDNCKIQESNQNRNSGSFALPSGFPSINNLAKKTGTVKWAVIPIEFTDLKGQPNFRSRIDSQMKLASEWFETASEGKFKVEWVVAENWVKIPNPTTSYFINQSMNLGNSPTGTQLFRDAMKAADQVFDFTEIQTVNFILPLGQQFVLESSQGFPWDLPVKELVLNEGQISSFSMAGSFFDRDNRQYWSYWVHEFGHAMGIPHIGSSREPNSFLNLDIMGNQDGFARELSGWNRFVAGWLSDSKVYCQELSKLGIAEFSLVPLSENKDGIKLAVIKLTETKAIVIESRRETKFSCKMPTRKNGLLVYIYDATRSHGENYLIPVTPEGRQNESSSDCPVVSYPDPHLYLNQSISVEGVKIQLVESQLYDKVKITRG
jgi:M6 family metalloprotease-like protein